MPSFIVYTAIIGGYDELPGIESFHPDITYVCFTDSPDDIGPHGQWNICPIESYFRDGKLTNGFIKANSHLLFGTDCITTWVDSSLFDIKLDPGVIQGYLQKSPIATAPHLLRDTVEAEADIVVMFGLETKSSAVRQLKRLHEAGYADARRLSATLMLMRDHRNPQVRKANTLWWDCISSGVRRDQLSFDYACWEFDISPERFDVNWLEPNTLFSMRKHKNDATRIMDASRDYLYQFPQLNMPAMPPRYPSDVCFISENWMRDELSSLHAVNQIVARTAPGGRVEGNYCHFHESAITPHTPPDVRRSWKREYLRRAVRGCRSGLEIGFNAGHSAVLILNAEPEMRLASIDIGLHPYTFPCAKAVEALFPHRFSFHVGDSRQALARINAAPLDFVHIDGGHGPEVVAFDVNWFCENAPVGCRLLLDDAYVEYIGAITDALVSEGRLKRMNAGLPSSGENQLFIKVK